MKQFTCPDCKVKINNGKKDYVELKLTNDVVDLVDINEEGKYDYKLKINKKQSKAIKKEWRRNNTYISLYRI